MKNTSELLKFAAKVIGISESEISSSWTQFDDIDAIYAWNPIRGGASVIIESKDSFLYATSAVNPDEHKKAFISGRRTDLELFE